MIVLKTDEIFCLSFILYDLERYFVNGISAKIDKQHPTLDNDSFAYSTTHPL